MPESKSDAAPRKSSAELTTSQKAAKAAAEIGMALVPGGGLIGAITRAALVFTTTPSVDVGDLSAVREETERQENEMRRLEAQAKVAQETAIAARIASAGEVQIEEYYEYAGDGKLGASADEKGFTLGASGSGKRISKRVYKFTGHIKMDEIAD